MAYGLQNNSRYFGQAAGMSKVPSSSGASGVSGVTGFLGAISPYAPLIGLGAQFIGGALDDTPEKQLELQREQLALQERERADQNRQFDQTFNQNKYVQERNMGAQGIGILADMRSKASEKLRKYNFRNAVLDAARGAA